MTIVTFLEELSLVREAGKGTITTGRVQKYRCTQGSTEKELGRPGHFSGEDGTCPGSLKMRRGQPGVVEEEDHSS